MGEMTINDLRRAYREGWKAGQQSVRLVHPTTARDEFYGTKRRPKATLRAPSYHASMFARWLKETTND